MHYLIGALCMLLSVIIAYKVLSREKKVHPPEAVPLSQGIGAAND